MFGSAVQNLDLKMPHREKKRRVGETGVVEEYWEYTFPEDVSKRDGKSGHSKLLQMASMWKKQKTSTR